jgi:hypothetical protein
MSRIYITILFLFSVCFAYSQQAYPEYAVGLRGGTSWSMMLFNPSISQPSMPMTYHAGAQFRMISEKYFGIKLELNYSQKGFKDTYGHRRLDYIELPFMTHITFGQQLFRFFIDLGPEIAYLIRDNNIQSNAQQHTLPAKNSFDYGIVGGLGFEFNTHTGIYTIDARYYFGLNNVMGNSASEYFKSSTNQNITLSLAYLFPLKN